VVHFTFKFSSDANCVLCLRMLPIVPNHPHDHSWLEVALDRKDVLAILPTATGKTSSCSYWSSRPCQKIRVMEGGAERSSHGR
jgi:hypothetical protein